MDSSYGFRPLADFLYEDLLQMLERRGEDSKRRFHGGLLKGRYAREHVDFVSQMSKNPITYIFVPPLDIGEAKASAEDLHNRDERCIVAYSNPEFNSREWENFYMFDADELEKTDEELLRRSVV